MPWLPSPNSYYGSSYLNTATDELQYTYQSNNWLTRCESSLFANQSTFNQRGFLNSLANVSENQLDTLYTSDPSSYSGLTYDAAGNRLTETVQTPASDHFMTWNRTITYSYDNRDRMTQESSAPSNSPSGYAATLTYDEFFDFDNADNLLGFKTSTAGATGFGVNSDNQLSSPTGFAFDADGSMTAEPAGGYYSGATLSYDGEDRLTAIGSLFSAGYDGNGIRATSTTSAGTVYYLYDGSGVPLVEETYNSCPATIIFEVGDNYNCGLLGSILPYPILKS